MWRKRRKRGYKRTGPAGETGPKGDKGDPGEKGEDGKDGLNGSSRSQGKPGETAYSNTILPFEGGTIIPSIGSATINDTFDLTLTVNSGYEFNGLYLDNEKANLTPTITSNSDGSYQYLFSDIDMKENGYVIRADLKKLSSEEIEKPNEDFYLSGGFIFTGANIDGDGNIINEGTKGDQLFEDGSGSKEVPLIIKSDEQLKNINKDNVKKIASKITFELSSDITTTETIDFTIAREVTLNLNGKNLSINNGTNTLVTKDRKLVIDGGKDLNNKGKLNIPQIKNSTASAITIDGGEIELNNVEYETTGSGLFPKGSTYGLKVNNSVLKTGSFGISTNGAETDYAKIEVENSIIYSYGSDQKYSTPILINVNGEVSVKN